MNELQVYLTELETALQDVFGLSPGETWQKAEELLDALHGRGLELRIEGSSEFPWMDG